VTRTLSNERWGDLECAVVGSGTMSAIRSTMGDKILYTAQLMDDDGIIIKFRALFLEPKNAHRHMQIDTEKIERPPCKPGLPGLIPGGDTH